MQEGIFSMAVKQLNLVGQFSYCKKPTNNSNSTWIYRAMMIVSNINATWPYKTMTCDLVKYCIIITGW